MLQRETRPFLIQEGSDWHECNRLPLLLGNAHISTAALSSCLGTIWASADGAAWGLSEVDSHPRLCFQALKRWGVSCSHTAKVATKAVWRMTFLPNTYWWLRSLPTTKAKNSFPICEYCLSATGSAPLLDVTGWPCCNSKKPSPSLDASPWPSASPFSLKYLSTGGFLTASLIFWKASFYSWVQIHSHSCVSGGVVALAFLRGFVGI